MRQIYLFYSGSRILTEQIATSEPQARELASSVTAVACALQPGEAPFEYRIRLGRAEVVTLPLADSVDIVHELDFGVYGDGENYGLTPEQAVDLLRQGLILVKDVTTRYALAPGVKLKKVLDEL